MVTAGAPSPGEGPARADAWPLRWVMPLVVAVLAAVPTLRGPTFADDWVQHAAVEGRRDLYPSAPWDLYRFADGVPAHLQATVFHGVFPWWTDPRLALGFLRPLSSLLLTLDHGLFGFHALGPHLHSMAWSVVLVYAVTGLYRRILPDRTAWLAAMLFALDPSRGQPAGWPAARHILVSGVPAFLGLWAWLRARQDGWRPGIPLAMGCLALGFLAGESTLGVVAFVAAYELLDTRRTLTARALGLVPVAVLSGVYLGVWVALGYGAHHSGSYVDPVHTPAVFAMAVPPRLVAMVGSMFSMAPLDTWVLSSAARHGLIAGGAVITVLMALAIHRAQRDPPDSRAPAWLGVGTLLSLVAFAGGPPGGRMLTLPAFGAMALLATLLRGAWARGRAWRAWAVGFGTMRGVLAPLVGLMINLTFVHGSQRALSINTQTFSHIPAGSRMVILAVSEFMVALFPVGQQTALGGPLPRSWNILTMSPHAVRIERPAAQRIVLSPTQGRFLDEGFEPLFRGPHSPLHVGDVVPLDGLQVRVLATDGVTVTRFEAVFTVPTEDPSWRFLVWDGDGLRPVSLPPVGGSVEYAPGRPLFTP